MAVGVFHAGEELDEHHCGVGGPVAVVAAVEGVVGAVDGDLKVGVAACAEDEGLAAGLVDGTIADEPDVAVDEVAVGHEDLFEMGEPASSSPSQTKRMLAWSGMCAAWRALSAVSWAKMAALSSPAPRA